MQRQLEKMGVAERTLVILTSDNGGLYRGRGRITDNAPLRGGKGQQWEGGIRVPAIVKWPGVTKPGSVCDEPIITMDFYPTILDIAGVPGDPGHNANIDGLPLVALLKGRDAELGRDTLYWHYPHYNVIDGIPHSIIRRGDHKLIKYYEDDHIELYDLANDVGEQHDLTKAYPELAARLHRQLRDHLREVDAQMPLQNPKYVAE